MNALIETSTGRGFTPLAPIISDIDPEDIAHHLSNQCRFSGATHVHYSVAEHCVRVARLLGEWNSPRFVQLWGLLHDASEAYLVDVPQPLKADPTFGPAYLAAEARLMRAVTFRFGLPVDEPFAVREADSILLATEARDLMPYKRSHWSKLPSSPLVDTIVPWSPRRARETWLETFVGLGGA